MCLKQEKHIGVNYGVILTNTDIKTQYVILDNHNNHQNIQRTHHIRSYLLSDYYCYNYLIIYLFYLFCFGIMNVQQPQNKHC